MRSYRIIGRRIAALLFVFGLGACGAHQTTSFVPTTSDVSQQSVVFHQSDPVAIAEYPLPSSVGAIAGPGVLSDGTLWAPAHFVPDAVKVLASGSASAISLAIMPGDCTVSSTQCEIPVAATTHHNSIWFLVSYMTGTLSNSLLEQVNPATGSVENYIEQPVSSTIATSPGSNVVVGDDGRLWYPECAAPTPCYVIANTSSTSVAYKTGANVGVAIASGPDNKLYMTETVGSTGADVVRIATDGAILAHYALPAGSQPNGIASGCDHNLWIAETGTNEIARVSITGAVKQFHVPTAGSQPTSIALGADGNMWFTESAGNKIGRITPLGTITEYSVPVANSEPDAIMGPYVGNCPGAAHGTLWFGQGNVAKVGKLTF